MKKVMTITLALVFTLSLVACMGYDSNPTDEIAITSYSPLETSTLSDIGRPIVTIEMEDGQTIKMKLVPEVAENTVNNFISLIEDNFYDGLTFHRVWEGFMIQGGDPNGDGTGGPGYEIPDEFYKEKDGVGYHLSHVRGVLSMAKTQFPDSAGSQFFIMHEDSTQLDLKYAAFGIVIEGMDVVDEIAGVETASKNKPVEDVIIKNISVDLNGYEYSEPIKVE